MYIMECIYVQWCNLNTSHQLNTHHMSPLYPPFKLIDYAIIQLFVLRALISATKSARHLSIPIDATPVSSSPRFLRIAFPEVQLMCLL